MSDRHASSSSIPRKSSGLTVKSGSLWVMATAAISASYARALCLRPEVRKAAAIRPKVLAAELSKGITRQGRHGRG